MSAQQVSKISKFVKKYQISSTNLIEESDSAGTSSMQVKLWEAIAHCIWVRFPKFFLQIKNFWISPFEQATSSRYCGPHTAKATKLCSHCVTSGPPCKRAYYISAYYCRKLWQHHVAQSPRKAARCKGHCSDPHFRQFVGFFSDFGSDRDRIGGNCRKER